MFKYQLCLVDSDPEEVIREIKCDFRTRSVSKAKLLSQMVKMFHLGHDVILLCNDCIVTSLIHIDSNERNY